MLLEKEDDGYLVDLNLAVRLNDNIAFGAPSKTGNEGVHGYRCSHGQASYSHA